MLKTKLAIVLMAGFVAFAANQAKAESIGINFTDPTTTTTLNDTTVGNTAGAPGYVQGSWNNIASCSPSPCTPPSSGTASGLVDSTGTTVTGLGLSYSADAVGTTAGVAGSANLTIQDQKLMDGALKAESSGDDNVTITLSGITAPIYALVVYFDSGTAGTTMHFLVNSSSIGYVDTIRGFSQGTNGSPAANYGFTQVTPASTLANASTATGNYFVVSGLSGSSVTVEAARTGAQINAIELITGTPEPASLGLLLLGLAGFAGYRKFKRA